MPIDATISLQEVPSQSLKQIFSDWIRNPNKLIVIVRAIQLTVAFFALLFQQLLGACNYGSQWAITDAF